ncbi:MAG TPA: pantoate kinase [Spirochaetia bacterium]|nr:pantoate kinase [Spirochaetia bacterium]
MDRATAFVPGHVTGLFSIHDEEADPLRRGSLGAGFSIAGGVTTEARLIGAASHSTLAPEVDVTINGVRRDNAVVSLLVARAVAGRAVALRPGAGRVRIEVDEQVAVPEGSGFGTSGAGALSVAYAVNCAYGAPLSLEECGQVAHWAEIDCGTGLGSVIAEAEGGMEIRVAPGAPGFGRVERFDAPQLPDAIFVVFGPLSTRKMLADPQTRRRINGTGRECLDELRSRPSVDSFLRLSRKFAERTGLISERVRHVLELFDSAGIPSSMLMFGEGVFTLVDPVATPRVLEMVDKSGQNEHLVVSKVDARGGRIINVT